MSKYDLSILIPSRNEIFLAQTVKDILKNKRGKTEIIVHLDGAWANPGIPDHPDVTIIYSPVAIGQRAGTNKACRISRAKYVAKADAHLAYDEGFDVKLMAAIQDDWTIVPLMRNLHVFDWLCPDGHRRYQGISGVCTECGKETKRDIVWRAKESPKSTAFLFDPEPHFQYFNEFKKRPEGQGELTETPSLQGSFFMLTRKKYWELDVCSDDFGSWGSQGIEVACKTWLSGGKVMCLQTTWYAHLFRTKGGDFGFPYPQSGNQVQRAKKHAKNLFFENKWDKQIYPLSWLLERFWPLPRWTDEDLERIKLAGAAFKPGTFVASSSSGDEVSSGKLMSSKTQGFDEIKGRGGVGSHDVLSRQNETKMEGITASGIIADNVIKDGDISTLTQGDRLNHPSVNESMDVDGLVPQRSISVSASTTGASPNPAPTIGVDTNLGKDKVNFLRGDMGNDKVFDLSHMSIVHNDSSKVNSKGIIFYTDNKVNTKIAHAVQDNLRKTGIPIVSSSLKPMPHFGNNIHIQRERGYLTMFKQQLAALEASTAEIVYMCEHDVLYHPSHFDFIPPRKDVFYYNVNVWKVDAKTGHSLWVDECRQVSGLVAYRELLIKEYRNRINRVERMGKFERGWGFEPGTKSIKRGGFSNLIAENFKSKHPNLDIRAEHNLTPNRWSKEQFRNQQNTIGWTEAKLSRFLQDGWTYKQLRFLPLV